MTDAMNRRILPSSQEDVCGSTPFSDLPGDWRVVPMKYLMRFVSGGTPSKDNPSYWGGEVPWISPKDMKAHLIASSIDTISELAMAETGLPELKPGTVLMVVRGMILARNVPVGLTTATVTLNQDMKALIPGRRLSGNFLAYLLCGVEPSLFGLVEESGHGTRVLRQELLSKVALPVPPLSDQLAIAAFLDRETAQIDALIEKQQRLLELLDEKRRAVITEAVTKGLDPSAPMKSSGIPWLGDIPAHWEVKRLKNLLANDATGIQMGPFGSMLTDLPLEPTGYRLYGQENTISGDFSRGDRWITEKFFESCPQYHLGPGDFVFTRKGSLGNCRRIASTIEPGIIDSDTIRVRVDESLLIAEYALIVFHEGYALDQIDAERRGAILGGLNSTNIANLIIALPPRAEQVQIAELIGKQSNNFEALRRAVQASLEALTERRAALISAAVTGQIDVRGEAVVATASAVLDRARLRLVVSAEILHQQRDAKAFGRVKLQKQVYLAEAFAKIDGIASEPIRDAAGPYDRALIQEIESGLARVGWFTASKSDDSNATVYKPGKKTGAHKSDFDALPMDQRAALKRIIALTSPLKKLEIEAVATLFAVWNDMLIDKSPVTDDAIFKGVLDDWHPEKKTKFKKADLQRWLKWMRANNLVPSGLPPRTRLDRLFA